MRLTRTLSLFLVIGAMLAAQNPDVIVGSLNGVDSYGNVGSTYSYALGTTSCNIGTTTLSWIQGTNQHPVIGQNIYRIKNGRFEQIGMSWLKHGFTALQGTLCSNGCVPHPNGTALGVLCSDPYSAGLNGSQGNGPRNEVNATTGYFPYPFSGSYPGGSSFGVIGRRIQCQAADIDPTLNAGATYYGEGQYVTADDAAAGNKHNNASYRVMTFNSSLVASLTGSTVQQQPAILAWQTFDPTVVITNVDDPQTGRFIIARKATSLGGGNFHYEFAVHNLNSDRSGRGFTVDFPVGTTITNAGFKDIGYHSGEPYSGTDWVNSINANSVNWATTQTYIQNVNANALRWGTTYNFWFDANAATESNKTIELFKPEPCPADPVIPASSGYTLNAAATFDNPTLTAPTNGPSGDDASLFVPIGFTFNFYGTNYTNLYISTNGFLTFVNAGTTQYNNTCLPNAGTPSAMVAGYWDDLNPTAGQIQYQTLGAAPNRRFVASWNAVPLFGAASQLQSFKIILDETTNVVTTSTISTTAGSAGSSMTRGVENQGGTAATQSSCNASGSAVASTSQTYTAYATILPSADLAVSGSTGPNGVLTWSINSNALGAPVILIASTDPGPLDLGPLGLLNIGLTPGAYFVLADGAGVLQPANPADFTDACGDYSISIPLGPGGLPPGLTIYNQGVILTTTSVPLPPNGQFHITDEETITT